MIRAEYACIIPVTVHLKEILVGNSDFERLFGSRLSALTLVQQKCQMFASLTPARRWRGWMRGSRTTSGRSAGRFSAEQTRRRRGGRSLRDISSGRRTTTHRNFTAGRLTGASGPRERLGPPTATAGRRDRRGRGRRRVAQRTQRARGNDVQKLQIVAPASVRGKGRAPTVTMTVRGAERLQSRSTDPAGRRAETRLRDHQCQIETCCWWNTVGFLTI